MKKLLILITIVMTILCTVACGNANKKIRVGASSTPHALILEQANNYVKEHGYELEIVVFDDYVLPNLALENGELDANYFQHTPYLNEFNNSNGTHLVATLKVHFEPMGVYKGTKQSLEDYQKGDTIIVPSDKSNYDRAVELLKVNGIEDANLVLVEAQNIPLMLQDCAYAVINGNYALSSGVVGSCLVTESKASNIANLMANIVAVKEGHQNDEKIKVLLDALKQENIKKYIEDTFGASVLYIGGE